MTAILGRTGNLVGFTTGRGTTPWDTEMEAALRKMDAMLASTVVAITNTLPGSANEGDLYLVGTSPTGVAAGWANRIARWRSSPAGWEAYQPMQGWIVTIVGETTNKVRRYNGTAWVALAADAGAEPYAGVPAQTSFWRSTATGVRAWVQLVAADITDLATTLAGYLTKTNPTFTGTLTGPEISLSSSLRVGMAASDSVGAGSWVQLQDSLAAPTKAWKMQLGASNDLTFWNYASGSWTKRWQFLSDGNLYQGGNQRITADGIGRFEQLIVDTLASGNLPTVTDAAGVLRNKYPSEFRTIISAAKAPSKLDVSVSKTLGSIDATAIKVTTTDVILTLSGGVDGQGWDIINPTTATGIVIPSGATLWKSIGFDVGPTTIALGGGRPIRITRIDANTWTMLGSQ